MKSLLATAIFALAGTAAAQSVVVNGGRWETSTSTSGYVIADGVRDSIPTQNENSTECWSTLKDRTLSEETIGLDNCRYNSKALYGNRMEYDLTCVFDGIEMDGDMVVIVAPDSNSFLASIVFGVDAPGVEIVSWSDMAAKRVGAC